MVHKISQMFPGSKYDANNLTQVWFKSGPSLVQVLSLKLIQIKNQVSVGISIPLISNQICFDPSSKNSLKRFLGKFLIDSDLWREGLGRSENRFKM